MNKCQETGCRNLELRCLDCGRLVNEYKPHNEWIDASKTLPEQYGWYLVFTEKLEILRFEGDQGLVKFWMPLPEVPC